MLAPVADVGRYGRVQLGERHEVTGFEEKGATVGPGLINAGIYLIHRGLIDEMPMDRVVSLEREVFPNWIGRGFYGFENGTRNSLILVRRNHTRVRRLFLPLDR